jgi:VIT1/CCC1 family predicted Fe2+/Mn2+ transporter
MPLIHRIEPHDQSFTSRLNRLRAGVLGANDGLVSTAGLVVGVAGATTDRHALFVSGMAGMLAGALSMAVGEYVSVSTQRDTERALIALESRELADDPHGELRELADIYTAKGLSPDLAHRVATQLTERDVLGAHLDAELSIDPEDLTNPWHAAFASFAAFLVGAAIPLVAVLASPPGGRVAITMVAVLIGMGLTGYISARLGRAEPRRAVVRNLIGGIVTMLITYTVGRLIGGGGGI